MATMTAPPYTDTVVVLREELDDNGPALIWTTSNCEASGLVARYRLGDGTLEVADERYDTAAMRPVLDASVAQLTEPGNGAIVWRIAEQRLVRRLADDFSLLRAHTHGDMTSR